MSAICSEARAIEVDAMRLINNGAICAVNAREMRRQEKWRQHNMLKVTNRHNTMDLRKADKNDRQRND